MRPQLLACIWLTAQALPAFAQIEAAAIPEPQVSGGRLGAAYLPLIERLRHGGLVLLFRHDRTAVTGIWDYEPFEPRDCARERGLSEAGLASARAIGDAIRLLRLPIKRVIASPYCRARDSAVQMFGGLHKESSRLLGSDGKARTLALVRQDISALAAEEIVADGLLVLVGHHGSTDAFVRRMLDEGDALILRPGVRGEPPEVLAHIPAARWEEIARDLDRARFEPQRD
jgi:phosphohistidine phosphatase SixA